MQWIQRLSKAEVRVALILAGFFFVVFLSMYVVRTIQGYQVRRDTEDWVVRAAQAGDARDMRRYIEKAIQGMEEWGFTQGNAALFLLEPTNNMGIKVDQLREARDRAARLEQQFVSAQTPNLTALQYNQGLDDLRQYLVGARLSSDGYYWRHEGLPITLTYYLSLALVLAFLARAVMVTIR